MPQSDSHNDAIKLVEAILTWWARSQPNTKVVRDLAIRWMKDRHQVGFDPDIAVFRPAPPIDPDGDLRSVRTWEPGHTPPILAIEVVSNTNPRKDYEVVPDKCEACGTPELCVFDPHLAGPRRTRGHGEDDGPHRLQLWRHDANGKFKRVYAGDGPVYSPTLNAYFIAVDEGRKLRISDDEAGLQWWLTSEEAERKAKEEERAEKVAARTAKEAERRAKEEALAREAMERAAKEEALARIAELEAQLAKATQKT
ncbi:MAG: Uma2 family endonuclease [Polyangiaceae bacterium]|nr:Uma2 family endonuclease [Polyangiaceae bacterium]